jgi:hypothetical protein
LRLLRKHCLQCPLLGGFALNAQFIAHRLSALRAELPWPTTVRSAT